MFFFYFSTKLKNQIIFSNLFLGSPSQNILEDEGACGETEKENNSLMSLIINKDNNSTPQVPREKDTLQPQDMYTQCKVSAINLSTPKCSPATTSPFNQQQVVMKQVGRDFEKNKDFSSLFSPPSSQIK